jgi:hypothetical protein
MATIVSQSISDTDMILLKSRIYDKDNRDNPAQSWIQGCIDGKINKCWLKFRETWTPTLMDDASVLAISASKDDFIQQVVNRSDYKDRWLWASGSGLF